MSRRCCFCYGVPEKHQNCNPNCTPFLSRNRMISRSSLGQRWHQLRDIESYPWGVMQKPGLVTDQGWLWKASVRCLSKSWDHAGKSKRSASGNLRWKKLKEQTLKWIKLDHWLPLTSISSDPVPHEPLCAVLAGIGPVQIEIKQDQMYNILLIFNKKISIYTFIRSILCSAGNATKKSVQWFLLTSTRKTEAGIGCVRGRTTKPPSSGNWALTEGVQNTNGHQHRPTMMVPFFPTRLPNSICFQSICRFCHFFLAGIRTLTAVGSGGAPSLEAARSQFRAHLCWEPETFSPQSPARKAAAQKTPQPQWQMVSEGKIWENIRKSMEKHWKVWKVIYKTLASDFETVRPWHLSPIDLTSSSQNFDHINCKCLTIYIGWLTEINTKTLGSGISIFLTVGNTCAKRRTRQLVSEEGQKKIKTARILFSLFVSHSKQI